MKTPPFSKIFTIKRSCCLPPRRKQVFEMSRIEGLSHKEIAEKLQIPVRTVEDHIYKTLTELHKVLMFVILPVLFP